MRRSAVRELAARRAREAIRAAQERLRDASHALPEHLTPLIKIINYGKDADSSSAGVSGGTGRIGAAAAATSPRPRPGMSGALRQFSTLRSTAAAAEPDSPEGPLSAVLGDEPCVLPVLCRGTSTWASHTLLECCCTASGWPYHARVTYVKQCTRCTRVMHRLCTRMWVRVFAWPRSVSRQVRQQHGPSCTRSRCMLVDESSHRALCVMNVR